MSATAIILGLVAIVVGVFAAVVKTLITDEVKAWLPHASTKLVNKAVDLLPPEHQERWREEWQADLVEYLEDERRLAGLQYSVQALRAAAAMRKTLRPQLDRLPADRVLVAIYVRRRGHWRIGVPVRLRQLHLCGPCPRAVGLPRVQRRHRGSRQPCGGPGSAGAPLVRAPVAALAPPGPGQGLGA